MSDNAKILLVDDEPAMLRYIRTLLEVDDYKVETASTGEEALQRVDAGMEPDLVLLDMLMPGIDGLETLEQLRRKRPGVKVVMLSCVNDTKKSCAGDAARSARLPHQTLSKSGVG
jgi:CheY-like chemotaxis protein